MFDKQEVDEVLERIEKAGNSLNPASNSVGNSIINVNAGGIGIWVTVSACALMFVMNIFLIIGMGLIVLNQSRKNDELASYITAIYMMAPQLKPQDK